MGSFPMIALVCLQVLQGSSIIHAFANMPQNALQRQLWFFSAGKSSSMLRLQEGDENVEADNSEKVPPTKQKWKKKRWLMLQDIITLIEKRDGHAPKKANEVVMRMQKLSELYQADYLMPDEQVYNLWINAIAKCSRNQNAGKQAESVLEEMRRNGLQPNIISYTTVMDAYAQRSRRSNKAAHEAEQVLFDLIERQAKEPELKASSITCDTVLKAWANRGDVEGAERAQEILQRLEQLNDADLRPTVHSYGIVVHAWASCNGGLQAAENAEAVLNGMMEPNQRVKPDTVVFNSCINAFAKCKDPQAGPKAVELLHRMQELHSKGLADTPPDSGSYGAVLSAWSHSNHPNAATETERVLKEMQEAHKESPCKSPAPNTQSFNHVLHAWSRSSLPGAADRAQKVLEFMTKSNRKIIAPDVVSFTSVLNAVAKSKDPEKATKARQLLDTMIQMHDTNRNPNLKPSPIPFNAVLNACAFSASDTTAEQQKAALLIATATFSELRKRSNPDTVSYGNMMKCFHNLMPSGQQRNDMALKLFDKCTEEGLVGELVWAEVRRTVQSRVLSRGLSDDLDEAPTKLNVQDLPKRWTNRVRGDKLAERRRSEAQARKRRPRPITRKRRGTVDRRVRSISEPSYQSGKDL